MVRHATYGDIYGCVQLGRKAHKLSGNYSGVFDERKAVDDLTARIMNPYALVLVNDDITGFLMAIAAESYYGVMKTGNEPFYAEKDGLLFVREYKKWALNWGPNTEVNLCLSFGGKEGARAEKLFIHEGFVNIGPQMRLKAGE